MKRVREAIAAHFQSWFDEIERWEKDPCYLINSRSLDTG
jgi:hypothetical protein